MQEIVKASFNENELELAIIELFKQQGYTHVLGDNIHRRLNDILLVDELTNFLTSKYKNEDLTATEIEKIINNLKHISPIPQFTAARETFLLINNGFDLIRDDESKIALHIDYIDFDNPLKNSFKIVNQFTVEGERTRRPDAIIFINGIPVSILEFKSAVKEDCTLADAHKQICTRYVRDIPALTKYTTLAVISDGANTKLGSPYTPYEFFYSWNKVNETETVSNGITSLFSMIKGAFAKERIISILRDFVYFADEKETVIVTRYPQFFGAIKMFESIKAHLKPDGDGKGGTYFGATGCGKTYTALFLSRLLALRDNDTFHNPTIIVLEDREDLDIQTTELFVQSKKYLRDNNVRSIESRDDLSKTLKNSASGGVYIITVQKFCESLGLLSNRNNIICISDEAHRTQTNTGAKFDSKTGETKIGFAAALRKSFPNATYCGFTGTPIDETLAVFGDIVDAYTMKESVNDGITVNLSYEPRLARVIVSDEQAKEINNYYQKCLLEGANENQVEESKKAMSAMKKVLGDPDRLFKLSNDIISHYEKLCETKPKITQKAMIVCADRTIAYKLYKQITRLRPEWLKKQKSENESQLTKEQLNKLENVAKINLVATRDKDDPKELYNFLGTKEYRTSLARLFKDKHSNFKIAIVVDMWITGFDVPELAVMYIDKPLQKHTLIQTISRVNRKAEGKEQGLIVDYIGIREDMLAALKKYGSLGSGNVISELRIALSTFRNHLQLLSELMHNFDPTKFFVGQPLERLHCLNDGAEFVQLNKETEIRFMGLSRRLKAAYEICLPSGELTESEISKAHFFLAIRSIIYKQTNEGVPDAEEMNRVVENMVEKAIQCTGIENIIDGEVTGPKDIFGEELLKEALSVKLPITKFNALIKLLKKAINGYGKKNKIKALEFDERLKKVVEKYNNRDLLFTSEVVADFINDLSDEIISIFNDLREDKNSFERLGVSFEEKVFYDILIKVRDEHEFDYSDEKCIILAKEIKKLVDDKAQYADWSTRDDIKHQLRKDLILLLRANGYPPTWNNEVFEQVMEQAQNFKKWEE